MSSILEAMFSSLVRCGLAAVASPGHCIPRRRALVTWLRARHHRAAALLYDSRTGSRAGRTLHPEAREVPMTIADPIHDENISARVGDKLKNRVAFVTGGTRGIGAAICRSLASQGAVLAAGYGGNDDAAKRFRDSFASTYNTPVSIHKGNVAEPSDCRRTIDEVIAAHGRLDILVNNAGITIDKTVLKMEDEDWFKVLNVNLSGSFFLSQSALRHMASRGSGRIVNVSSIIGETGNIGQANYAASKSGLFGLTKTLAKEAAFLLARAGK